MKRWLPALLLACCALASGAAVPTEPSAADSDAGQAAPPQVMVMLHLPPPHFRADAGYAGSYQDDSGRAARRRIVQELAQRHGLTLVSDWPMPALGIDCFVLALPPAADPARVAAQLASDPRVEWAQPVAHYHTLGQDDPLYPVQPAAASWHLDELHRASTGREVRVAVIDSGIDEQHPDLAGQLALRENFIDASPYVAENHGTGVAAIIAARVGHGGILGVAPGARLLALRACRERVGHATQCDSFSLGKALNFAIMRDTQVINLSLSGPSDRLLQRLLDAAKGRGIRVVAASDPLLADGGFPASWPGVFAVSDGVGAASPATLLAPGRDIPTAAPGARWNFVSGPSYAAAHVSGLLALMAELAPKASSASVLGALRGAGGGIDACAAVGQSAGHCVCSCGAGIAQRTARLP